MDSLAEAIRQIPIFAGLAREDLSRIAGNLVEQKVSAGQVIFSQGDIGDALYIVKSGAVEVVVEHENFRVKKAFLWPLESFGEMALLTGEKRSATVLAVVDSVVLKLGKAPWDDFISNQPELSLYFYKILTRRLTRTERDMTKGLRALDLVMEEFFNAQPATVQDFLVQSAVLEVLDADAIRAVLALPQPDKFIADLSGNHPGLVRKEVGAGYRYLDQLREFLSAKLTRQYDAEQIKALHRRFGDHFTAQSQWAEAIHHYIQSEAWGEAVEYLETCGGQLLEKEQSAKVLKLIQGLPPHLIDRSDSLTRLRAAAYEQAGDLDKAIKIYRDYLSRKKGVPAKALEIARRYEKLADLRRTAGKAEEALDCLKLAAEIMEEGQASTDALQAMDAIVDLQEVRGSPEGAFRWEMRTLEVARKLAAHARSRIFFSDKRLLFLIIALAVGYGVWSMPQSAGLDQQATRFLATLLPAIILWVTDAFEIYIVALMMLIAWILLDVVPPQMALAGFSKSSWIFVLSVLGIGAAVTRSGLLVTPLLPENKARTAIMAPVSRVISEIMGFKDRSNGSAGIVLSAYIGFSQMTFMFLTAAASCFVGWSLMGEAQQAEFGWFAWALAAAAAGLITLFLTFAAIQIIFRVSKHEQVKVDPSTLRTQLEILGPLTRAEWLSVAILTLALAGWLTKPLHGIKEAWVAVAALVAFMLTGGLTKKSLKNNVDWGYLLFLAVMLSLSKIIPYLKLDRWLTAALDPLLMTFSSRTTTLLIMVALLVYGVRFFLNKSSTVVLFMLVLGSWSQNAGIHPGVLLLTVLMALESWFLPYQTSSYQIAYYSTDEKAFSHAQARKLMIVKFIVSLVAVVISVPYWKLLGFIQ